VSSQQRLGAVRRNLAAMMLGGAVMLGVPSVWAEVPQTPTTGVAFDEAKAMQTMKATQAYQVGVKHLDAKEYDQALASFHESYGVVKSPNSRLMVVRVLLEMGDPVAAYREALLTMVETKEAAKKAKKYEKTIEAVQQETDAIRQKIALVTVTVSDAPEDASLTINGQEVDGASWGSAMPFEPGQLELVLTTGDGSQKTTLKAEAGGEHAVTLSPPNAAPAPAPEAAPEVDTSSGYEGPDRRVMAYIAGGVGLLGFVGFGAFGLLSNGQFDRLDSGCDDPDFCDEDLEDEADLGSTYQTVANVSLVVGIVGVAGGAGLFLWDVFDPAPADGADARNSGPRVSVGPGSVSLSGAF
jgi:hypothetical protein